MSEAFHESPMDPELQVRVMNLVLGEASDFERDQLQALMEENAELAAYYNHLLHVHGLLGEAAMAAPAVEVDTHAANLAWQLPADRRQMLLAVLDGRAPVTPTKSGLGQARLVQATSPHPRGRKNNWGVAALIAAAAATVLAALLLPAVQSAREAARRVDRFNGYATGPYGFGDTPTNAELPSSSVAASTAPVQLGQQLESAEFFAHQPQSAPGAAGEWYKRDESVVGKLNSDNQRAKGLTDSRPGGTSQRFGSTTASPNDLYRNLRLSEAEGKVGQWSEPILNAPAEAGAALSFPTRGIEAAPFGVNRTDAPDAVKQDAKDADFVEDLALLNKEKSAQEFEASKQQTSEDIKRGTAGLNELAGGKLEALGARNLDESKPGLSTWDLATQPQPTPDNGAAGKPNAFDPSSQLSVAPVVEAPVELGLRSSDMNSAGRILGRKAVPQLLIEALDEQSAAVETVSTFSLHVSDVSFKLAQAALSQGQWPAADKIRIEEFVNALHYYDPLPSQDEKVACKVEQAIHPFLTQRNVLRISMRTAATGRSQNTPLRLTLLLDNSGSMERPDRRQALLKALQALTAQLTAADQVTLISFATKPRLLADKVPGNQGETLLRLIENLPSEGGTNIEAALSLGREKALENKLDGAQNRIVLFTDGAVNLGNANPESLSRLVTQGRDAGIAFDAAGISAQDLNDAVLEALTRQGDGRYYLLDSAETVNDGFAAQIAGALRPSAQNVKVQVEFNPQRVGQYKLLGFDKHRLNKEDFRNDQVDAAEMSAAEAGVAVYQYEVKPNGTGDVGHVSVRFRDVTTGEMIERRWPILYDASTARLEQASSSMRLAASAAFLAAKLGGGALADSIELPQLQRLLANLPEQYDKQPRVAQLREMIQQAIAINH